MKGGIRAIAAPSLLPSPASLFGQRNLKSAVAKMRKTVHDNDPALADLKL